MALADLVPGEGLLSHRWLSFHYNLMWQEGQEDLSGTSFYESVL